MQEIVKKQALVNDVSLQYDSVKLTVKENRITVNFTMSLNSFLKY